MRQVHLYVAMIQTCWLIINSYMQGLNKMILVYGYYITFSISKVIAGGLWSNVSPAMFSLLVAENTTISECVETHKLGVNHLKPPPFSKSGYFGDCILAKLLWVIKAFAALSYWSHLETDSMSLVVERFTFFVFKILILYNNSFFLTLSSDWPNIEHWHGYLM